MELLADALRCQTERALPGLHLQIKCIWSVLLRNFDFELVDPFPQPDFQSMVVGPKPCRVQYRRRRLEL